MVDKYHFIEKELAQRRQLDRYRSLRPMDGGVEVQVDGRCLVNFSSNDYLGLARHPQVQRRAAEFIQTYGAGATASRLVCGEHPGYASVETKLACLKGRDKALLLSSGFQANVSLVALLADRHSLLLCDRLCHNSLIQGARLSGGQVRRYRHNDLNHLRQLLQDATPYARRVIVSESVFSMDGDRSDIAALVALAAEFDAFLVVDEAHATGVLGPQGAGLCYGHEVDLVIGTLGKAFGAFGAYIACDERLWDYVVNCCPGFIYTTALPPAVLGAVDAALELVPQMDAARGQLARKAEYVRGALRQAGWDTLNSSTQVIPVRIGGEAQTLELAAWLEDQGFLGIAIRPPTVASDQARIRLALTARHSWDQVEALAAAFNKRRVDRG